MKKVYSIIFIYTLFSLIGCTQPPTPKCIDKDNDGFGSANLDLCPSREIDCDDSNPKIHPGMAEDCDGLDNDCDGAVDEGCECIERETRQCGVSDVGECEYGEQECVNGEWSDCIGAVLPSIEVCGNGLDEDCDGSDKECPVCGEGIVTERCKCGSTIVESGYCCSGLYSTKPCTQQEDPIQMLREHPLEGDWERKEAPPGSHGLFFSDEPGSIATFVFENNELICKISIMPGLEPKTEYVFAFFEPGTEPTVFIRGFAPIRKFYFEDSTLLVVTLCGDEIPPFISNIIYVLGGG